MSLFRDNYNSTASNIERVVEVILSIWNPDDILKGSVCEVFSQDTYENSIAKPNGLFDGRMGTIENGQVCETCKMDNRNCTGHFGHIRLAKPVYYIQFLSMVLKVLKCVCWRCSKCLINTEDLAVQEIMRKTKSKGRFLAVYNWCQKYGKNCLSKEVDGQSAHDGCGVVQPTRYIVPKREKDGVCKIYAEFKEQSKESVRKYLPAEKILSILKRITNNDVELIGLSSKYSRPDWMICTVLPVPPPHVRPSVRQDGNQKAEDDLTHKLSDIVKTNNSLKDKMLESTKDTGKDAVDVANLIDEWHQLLQYHVATLVDNEIPGLPPASQRGSGRPLKSLKQRLSAKEGRMRNNLMGKRCDFTARSVITPDANIALDELGVPKDIAMNLTIPVIVTPTNKESLELCIRNGHSTYPGAKSIIRVVDSTNIHLGYVNVASIKLEYGDIVNRHLIDGDVVLFNRQPSLHKMSMMGHRVRVLPKGLTFRLNVSVTTPYNADFDGDEMNTHLSQSYQTQAELKYLTLVPTQMVSPQKNAPVIGIVQDSLTAANLFTTETSFVNKKEMCRLMMWNDSFDGKIPTPAKENAWSGRQLYSTILPEINIEKKTKKYVDGKKNTDEVLRIQNGKMLSGVLDKTNIGNVEGGLVHMIWKDYSEQASADFIYNTQKIVNNWLVINGYSVGISDCLVTDEINENIQKNIVEAAKKVSLMIQKGYEGTYNTRSDRSVVDDLEGEIKHTLNSSRDNAGKIGVESLTNKNRLVNMIVAGSKGDSTNLAQIIGCLGQSEVEGKRVPLNMEKRTLPFYCKDDNGAEARGFIPRSFKVGLTPQHYFYHAMAGRIGLIDTAVKTSETGYIQRRLIKSMEDISVKHDHTVRDSAQNILQFQYGEDGYDACRLETITIDFHMVSFAEFIKRYHHIETSSQSVQYWTTYLTKEAYTSLMAIEVYSDTLEKEYQNILARRKEFQRVIHYVEDKVYSPIQLRRSIQNVIYKYKINEIGFSDLHPVEAYEKVSAMITKMKDFLILRANNVYRTRAQNTLYIVETLMMTLLSSKQIMTYWKLNRVGLDLVLHECYKMFLRGIVNPGEMVGIIASQSIGEPATQMCVDGKEVVTVLDKKKKECYHGPIGTWIDRLLSEKTDNETLSDRFIVNNMSDEEYYIHAVDMNSEKMNKTYRIRQISRLPANGKMMKITTRTGREVTATMSHAFLRRLTKGMEKVTGDKLSVGDRIPIAYRLPTFDMELEYVTIGKKNYSLDESFGSFIGCFLSNGIIDGDQIRIDRIPTDLATTIQTKLGGTFTPVVDNLVDYVLDNSDMVAFLRLESNSIVSQRRVPSFVFVSSLKFMGSVLRCYLDGDGNIAKDKHTIRCCSTSQQLIEDVCLLLNYFHIVPYKFFQDNKSLYHLGIFTKYADNYLKYIGSNYQYKLDDLKAMVDYNNREDCKSQMEFMDKIPKLGEHITNIAKRLGLDKISRTYLRWANVESIGRRTLKKYMDRYEMYQESTGIDVEDELTLLRQGYNCDVIWDKIMNIDMIPEDNNKLVYDLSIEGAETFMLGSGVLVHNTLNTFHYSGVSAKSQTTTGVPRLKELLTISKNPKTPSLSVFLKKPFSSTAELAKKVTTNITICTMENLMSEIELFYEIRDKEGDIDLQHEEDRDILDAFEAYQPEEDHNDCVGKSRWVIRMVFNKMKLNQNNISMYEIYQKLKEHSMLTEEIMECVYADDNADNLVFRIHVYINDNVQGTDENAQVNNNLFLNIRKLYKKINKFTIKGISGISGSYIETTMTYQEKEDGGFSKDKKEFTLSTDGTNLEEVLNLYEVDAPRTVSNNVNEIYELFGIEAARQALIDEINSTLSATAYVNFRHICVLADVMTHKGILLAIDIHGVKKSDIGPLARASFEETVDQLVKSSCFAEADKMTGVSANIMLGQVPPSGTGVVQLLFDERKMYIQTKNIENTNLQEQLEEFDVDVKEIEDTIYKASKKSMKCLDPTNYEFDFVPMGKSTIRKDKSVEFSVGTK
ncbi:DNA-directed RNA polymerase subunit A' [bacterium]|nr:DNA-directed RNA polymerase subunit A' [bacterium]